MLKKLLIRFKNFVMREKHILIAFGLTAASLTVFAIMAGVAPFGNQSLLAIDLYGQYYPMMAEKLSDFFGVWSWHGGLGFSAVAQSAYYTNSIFLLLLLPFKGYARLAAMDIMIFLKLALASAACAYYLGKKFERNDVLAGILGAAYGLGAYTLAFISQPMWLDVVLLLPLILHALERMVSGQGSLSYTLHLFEFLYFVCAVSVSRAVVFPVRADGMARLSPFRENGLSLCGCFRRGRAFVRGYAHSARAPYGELDLLLHRLL